MELSEAHKKLLAQLVTSLFPIGAWVSDNKALGPEPAKAPPWRESGATLCSYDLKVAGFIEALLEDDAGDETLARRFQAPVDELLALQDGLGRSRWWRTPKIATGEPLVGRDAESGPAASSTAEERTFASLVRLSPLTRPQLYERCLIALSVLIESRGLLHPDMPGAAWAAFLDEIKTPSIPTGWPEGTPAPVEFLRQLNKDCLDAAWKFDRPADIEHPGAVTPDAGEGRRLGNRYTTEEVKAAVIKLERLLKLKPIQAVSPE